MRPRNPAPPHGYKKRRRRRRRQPLFRRLLLAAVILIAVLAVVAGIREVVRPSGSSVTNDDIAGAGFFWGLIPQKEMDAEEERQLREKLANLDIEYTFLETFAPYLEAEYDNLPVEPKADALTMDSVTIGSGGIVTATASGSSLVASTDGTYLLIAQDVYQSGTEGTVIAEAPAGTEVEFTFELGEGTADSCLYKRFLVAVNYMEELTAISDTQYITNPEAVAGHTVARDDGGKKGILPASQNIGSSNLSELGVDQALYNVRIGDICAGTGINFSYNGRTYSFSSSVISQLDYVVTKLNAQGIQMTFVLLNNAAGDSTMIHPLSRGGSSNYYAFNTAEKAGVEKLEAVAAYLALRYSGTGHGTVDNWIVGNEVNARADWHYMSNVDLTTFTTEYAKSYRIFYNAIRSYNANARVYISMDQQWSICLNSAKYYSGRSFLSEFNSIIKEEGNIDWHVAIHPYNVPLTEPRIWKSTSKISHSWDTQYISMLNIDVLTDYLGTDDLLSPTGEVRSVLCSELGYTSSQGEELQAASAVVAYLQAVNNQHIDGIILSRELDDSSEIAQGLANGLIGLNGVRKLGFSYYANIDTANAQQYIDSAEQIMGIDDIYSLITKR